MSPRPLARLAPLVRPYTARLVVAFLFLVVAAAAGLVFPAVLRYLHEAAFELIEIPHVRMSGKNSADIRMVVDALDLCYSKSHIDTFALLTGDSDFSPLVSKLKENDNRMVLTGHLNVLR